MPYNGLDVIFDTWSAATDIKTDVYALHIDSNPENSKASGFKSYIRFLVVNEEKLSSYLTARAALYKQINHITFNLKISLANPIYLKSTIV